jgi:hypothetical protein
MNDEYPDQGAGADDEDLYSERTVAGGPSAGDAPVAAADPAGPPPTGDDRVDAAVAGLNRLAATSADEHVAVLEEVHGRLRDILGELDETPETSEEPGQR